MLIYRFTSGVHASQGGTPWDTARVGVTLESIPTTRLLLYDAIAAALEAAGYERFDRKLAGVSLSQANRDDVWYSPGEDGKKHITFRTSLHNHSGAAGSQYLSVIISPKRNDAAAALSGTWTWNGTTTVSSTNTSQVRIGSFIKANSDGQWFKISAVAPNVSVTIVVGGFTIPNVGATASSVLAPDLEGDVGNANLTGTAAPFNVDQYRWDLGASDFSSDFQILASKDFFWCVVQNTAHTGNIFVMFVGELCPLDVNTNVMHLSAPVTAGEFKELVTVDHTGAAVNPILLGFRPMDRVQIVEVDPLSGPKAETQTIVRVLSDRIVVRQLRFGYQGRNFTVNPERYGARIGMLPSPIGMHLSQNIEFEETLGTNNFKTPFFHDAILDAAPPNLATRTQGDVCSSVTAKAGENFYFIHYAQLTAHTQTNDEYGSGITPNDRTLRFTTRSTAIGHYTPAGNNTGNSLLGKVPALYTYNGSVTYYPHDNFLRDRTSPNQDFVPMHFTAASARNYALGPTPGP